MRRLLAVLGEMHRIMPEDAIDEILELADKDANGKLSYVEFIDLV
jgi:Ca2+-binding EF-hand superfamily protein